ncbi:metallophosphoesterase [Paenibacillus albicereus]|uniref:Metallophosphoesterase n=1 Tax=Paenibacillus albicereus TaxID=2726185 RepID=A0A6H2GWQ4_9BACL|nr:metallophosphoesterase [Paenibacillus albicereus]QJC51837.1 metallophosphoesterase [Paenibacillus albicereus]
MNATVWTVLAAALAIAAALGLRAVVRLMLEEARGSDIVREEVPLERLPSALDGLRVLFISDIHRRRLDSDLPARVEALGGAELVLIGGDVREKGVSLEQVRSNMALLRSIAPAYAVYGNHDYDGEIEELRSVLEAAGVLVLRNRHEYVRLVGREAFRLAGTDDPRTKRDRLGEALSLPACDRAKANAPLPEPDGTMPFTVLLAHDPILAHRSRHEGVEADLMLSGHTHGGQILLPLLGPAMRSSSVRKFRAGWFDLPGPAAAPKAGPRKVRLLVSSGYGTSKAPIRLNCPPEIHLLRLTRSDSDR